MIRKLEIHVAAAEEAVQAVAWYEHKQLGLGEDFRRNIDAALDLLQDGLISGVPMLGPAGLRAVRRLVLKRFPYDVVFVERDDSLRVLAFVHHSRRPGFWRDRLGGR